jgi:hypothetical protein
MIMTSRSLSRLKIFSASSALDVRFRADVLGDVERPLERLIEPTAGMAVLERKVVGLLELAKDFGLAQHHRIQAACDFEEMVHALRLAPGINLVRQRVAIVMAGDQEVPERSEGPGRLQLRDSVYLDPVAGGEDNRLVGNARVAQRLEHGRHARLRKSKSLPHVDRRGVMAEAEDDERHFRKAEGREA